MIYLMYLITITITLYTITITTRCSIILFVLNLGEKLTNKNNIIQKLTGSECGADLNPLRTLFLALLYFFDE